MTYIEELVLDTQSLFDEYLMMTEGRGISWGEVAHIENLPLEKLEALNEELLEELN